MTTNRSISCQNPPKFRLGKRLQLLIAAHVACCARATLRRTVGILAELEYALIQEQTKAGRAAAVARSVGVGRKLKLTPPTGGPCP